MQHDGVVLPIMIIENGAEMVNDRAEDLAVYLDAIAVTTLVHLNPTFFFAEKRHVGVDQPIYRETHRVQDMMIHQMRLSMSSSRLGGAISQIVTGSLDRLGWRHG